MSLPYSPSRLRAVFMLLKVSALFALCGGASWAATAEPPPNILWIMSDDHAVNGAGAYGGRLASLNLTPNIDRLAREGVRLTNAFRTNSICTPNNRVGALETARWG
jgi:hypothetical protein